jgi:hypothetical protein
MSADNGVYILETKGPEYRVAYASAIDNLTWAGDDSFDGDWNKKSVRDYFGESKVYTNLDEAYNEAHMLHDNWSWTEYGICILPYGNKEFPKGT